jgi:hypothetical protein
VTYRTGGDGADAVELLSPAVGEAPLDEPTPPEAETTNMTEPEAEAAPDSDDEAEAAPDSDDEAEAAPEPAAWTATDEWDDLRQVLAGEDQPAPVVDEDEEHDDEDEIDEEPAAVDELAELAERVDQLAFELREERAARERLTGQLDRLAEELDAVLGEALATERQGREQLEETLRQVQSTLSESSPAAFDGPERRAVEDRRTASERRRGLPARPLRARPKPHAAEEQAPEPVDEVTDQTDDSDALDVEPQVEEQPSVWKSRLSDVAGSVSAWSSDDIERLRVD